ncbi:hypothetical protein M1141_01860 [Candidatus Marsarchaeota archaeon]|nr:hypothetical protein [Candidatus Marsarchaeota archaeon]
MEIATKYKAGAFFAGMDLSGIDLGKYYKASKVLDIASMRRFAIADSV